jgi:hypothetical protein
MSSSDENLNVARTTLGNVDNDVKQQVVNTQGAKSEPMKLEMIKIKGKLLVCLIQNHNQSTHSIYRIHK